MAAHGSGSTAAPPSSTNGRSGNNRPPLPLSIVVRNLFPPFALSCAATADDVDENETSNDASSSSSSGRQTNLHQRKIKSMASKLTAYSQVEDRCALVSEEVLLRLRLEVVAKTVPESASGRDDDNHRVEGARENDAPPDDIEETLLYSREQYRCAAHPRWDHMNEQISDTKLDSNDNTTYYARFAILGDESYDRSSSTDVRSKRNERILVEVPLHPSQLRRLPATTEGDADDIDGRNNNTMIIPHSLPPNTVIVHYEDGHTRVIPRVYRTLVRRGIIAEGVVDLIKREGSGEGAGKSSTLFEERAFDVLGGEAATFANARIADVEFEGRMNGNVTGSEGETLEGTSQQFMYDGDRDRAFDLLGKPTESNNAQTLQISKPGSKKEDAIFDDRASDLLGNLANTFGSNATLDPTATEKSIGCERELAREGTVVEPINAGDGMVDQVELSEMHSQPDTADQRREDAMPSSTLSPLPAKPPLLPSPRTTEDEVEELRCLVREEQQLLEEEMQLIVQWRNHLRSTIQRVQQLENETIEIMSAVGAERTNLFRSEFRLDAHRIHLLQQLQLIFPVKLAAVHVTANPPDDYPQHQYTIAGLPLPEDIHNLTVTDDEVSTALGFLCHFISLTSKYLAIPLRYTVVCKWSRSAILFDQGRDGGNASKVVHPLFRERGVIDREQLDYGLMLLERNVNCLLHTKEVEFRPGWNILAKMDRLLMQVIEGADPSFGGNAG